ncbi:BREX-1 system adenine-specific DNA-methyltransferase PglX [Haloferula sp. A504]|uniref:BREX-1 system adenine-specific DNA-methyltransferase PglX n=1 Tax=Haloferula sp. A504 TaxID=3373601 RepID=UPI0031C68216|nr:BREX-1 system adenine-specific DNA-methyltransferase PglX [Verrucomicrobiaceae bacterium E54]
MNTSSLKSFAPEVRTQLMEAVDRKLDYVLTADTPDLREMGLQVAALRREAEKNRKALIERVAYTWFNRLAALRFLDARGWHPFKARVLTPATRDETQPEILKLLRSGSLPEELRPHTDLQRLNDLLDGRLPTAIAGADPQGEAYRGLILAACRCYHALMPFLFEAIDDETELLLPDDLLTATSVAEGFRTEIIDDDCAEVEILGWLYQFYISEKKDAVMARKKAVPSEDIPAVTQLFTPHWIVRYLVENSLGRLWLRSRPNSRLKEHMPYYVEDPDSSSEASAKGEGQTPADSLTVATPEEIKLLDPACGSGHMLTYAFDLLVKIYEEEGHAPSEIPEKILTHNLFGLEICPRAAQLAQFALVCKAREQSRTAFRRPVQPQIMCLRDVALTPDEVKGFTDATGIKFSHDELAQIHQFRENTETFGSLIQPVLDGKQLIALKGKIAEQPPAGDLLVQNTHRKLRLVADQAEMLSQRYQIVVANPPYLGGRQMSEALKSFAKEFYPGSKADLFSMFIDRGFSLAAEHGYNAMITMQSWMFLSSFELIRKSIVMRKRMLTMAHLGSRAFDSIAGEVVQATAFVVQNDPPGKSLATYFRLVEGASEEQKSEAFKKAISKKGSAISYSVSSSAFASIPGSPVAYWAPEAMLDSFKTGTSLKDVSKPLQGATTSDNARFLRQWHEVGFPQIGFACDSRQAAKGSGLKWFPYNKGGEYRKWYGNQEFVINYLNDGEEIKAFHDELNKTSPGGRLKNQQCYFKKCISWSKIGAGDFAIRFFPTGFIFDVAGSALFPTTDKEISKLGSLLNSCVSRLGLQLLSPTLNFEAEHLCALPVLQLASKNECFDELVDLARADWDNFETSWDFRDLPLLRSGDWEVEPGQPGGPWKGRTLAESWANYVAYCTAAIRRMQELETENNRLWIDAYGLQDELTPEVPEDEITLARADSKKDMAAFLSYAVGCMMGRYSLDHPGLILADAGDTVENYLAKTWQRTEPLDEKRAIQDPESVVLIPDAQCSCFACDKVGPTEEARFILADLYDREEGEIKGRPMIYCESCATENADRIVLNRPLTQFSVQDGLTQEWAEPETLGAFLDLAKCFAHRIPRSRDEITFPPDDDAIVPLLDGEWFTDDIVARTRELLRVTFGDDTLEENLRFIEDALGKDLRKYFLTDFYKDHLQTYKKRPIYWLFQSPKKGFGALVYLHRYTRDTVNTLLNDYLRDFLKKLESRIEHLEHVQDTASSAREKNAAAKEEAKLKKTLKECREWERDVLLPLAQQRLEIDLDDGVKANYPKFGKALASVPGMKSED